MAVIQFYLKDRQFADLVDRAEGLGISAHQLAKVLALTSDASDADVMFAVRQMSMEKKGRHSVRPLG